MTPEEFAAQMISEGDIVAVVYSPDAARAVRVEIGIVAHYDPKLGALFLACNADYEPYSGRLEQIAALAQPSKDREWRAHDLEDLGRVLVVQREVGLKGLLAEGYKQRPSKS